MRRTATSALLIVCLSIFLCPAVGKPSVPVVPQKHSCCVQTTNYVHGTESASERSGCAGKEAPDRNCCPITCSALVLFFAFSECLSVPQTTAQGVSTSDAVISARSERPPVPPPRV